MPVEYTQRQFTYKVPDEWRGNTFDQGKTATFTYKGPRFLTFEIDVNTGRETGWCLWEERDLERPAALDIVRITVDAHESDEMALLCEIANDAGDPDQVQFRTERVWKVRYQAPEGYQSIWEPEEGAWEPRDFYDEFNITYDFLEQKFNLPVKDYEAEGWNYDITWDDIREKRNRILIDTDGKLSPDMPQSVSDQWTTYRNLLRNLPTALAEFPAYVAAHMFPKEPAYVPPSDNTNKIMYTGGGTNQG